MSDPNWLLADATTGHVVASALILTTFHVKHTKRDNIKGEKREEA